MRRESSKQDQDRDSSALLSRRALALEVAATAAALLAADSAAAIPLPTSPAGAVSATSLDTTITHVVDFKMRIAAIQASRSEDGGRKAEQGDAIDGSMTLGLYGNAAPKTVRNFLTYCVPGEVLDSEGNLKRQPSYASSILGRMEPGVSVEFGKIRGLNTIDVAGSTSLEYAGKLYPLAKALDPAGLSHNKRGLLTRRSSMIGPEFAVTLAPSPQLDGDGTVFGRLLEGDDFLAQIEEVPIYTFNAARDSGPVADVIFQAQKDFFYNAAKAAGDTRAATDLRGKLLRKVDVREFFVKESA